MEDVEARAQAKEMRQDIETLRTGSLEGPPMYTHGGKEAAVVTRPIAPRAPQRR